MSTARSYFETKIKQYAEANNIPVSFENVQFTKPASGCFLELFMFRSNNMFRDVAAQSEREIGLAHINVWVPTGVGMGVGEKIVEDLETVFPVLPKDSFLSIESRPNSHPKVPDSSGYYIIPVTIKYRIDS